MDGTRKTQGTQEKSILCDLGNENVRKLCKSKKEKSKKRKRSLDEFQRTDVGSVETDLKTISAQGCEIGSKETKLKSDSLTSSATVKGQAHCGEKEDCPSASNASHCEVSSSSSTLTVSKRKKSRPQRAVSDFDEVFLPCSTTVELLTNECEQPSTSNGRKKKKTSKRDKQMVFRSPLLFDDDLLERIEEDEVISDKRTEASLDITSTRTNLGVCSLNRKSADNVREATIHGKTDCSVSANLDEFPGREKEGSKESSKKSRKMQKGRTRKEAKSKLAVDVELSDVEKPTETAFINQARKKNRTEEEFAAKDSKSSVDSLIDTDAPRAEKQHKTKTSKKRKRKDDGSHVIAATSLPSESPHCNSPAQLPKTEGDGDDDVVSESPGKKQESFSEAEVETIEHKRRDHMNELFWVKPAATGAGVPRPNKNLFRRKMRCPVDGCLGRSTRINRHILDCHPELELSEREDLVDYVMENPCEFLGAVPAFPVVPALKKTLRCPVEGCFGLTIRLRRHLITCHWELTPVERDELWEKVTENPSKYMYNGTLTKSSTSKSKENTEVTRAKKSSAGIPRPNFKVRSRRRKQNCPLVGCHGAAINMRRHLMDCHSEIVEQHEDLLEKLIEQRRIERAEKKALKEQKKLTCQVPSDTANCDALKDESH